MNDELVRKIAELARLKLTDTEVAALAPQLASIFNSFNRIAQIPTEHVEPLVTPSEISFYARPDVPLTDVMGAELTLANAPERSGNLFKVPPVV